MTAQIHCSNGSTQSIKYFGTVATLSADNLAAHDIGGFRRSFSSGLFCRYCNCSFDELKVKFHENDFILRSAGNHAREVSLVENNPGLVSLYGVRQSCPLSALCGFNPVLSIPPDIMHDCLEGVVPALIKLVFVYLNKHVPAATIKNVNKKLQNFLFGKTDRKNKPRCLPHTGIKPDGNISLSASEAWCLFRVLPFVVGCYFKQGNATWKLYCLLSNIMEIVFAPRIKRSWLPELNRSIENFYECMIKFAPQYIKPKFHFLIHYPQLIEHYGPLRQLWCMRFEAFHQKVKAISRSSRNFKNICCTVADRVQKLKGWEQNSGCCVLESMSYTNENVNRINISSLPSEVQAFLCSDGIYTFSDADELPLASVVPLAKATFKGVSYALDYVLTTSVDFDGVPLFGKIKNLFHLFGMLVVVMVEVKVVLHEQHWCCYKVKPTDKLIVTFAGQELGHRPLDLYKVDSHNYVRLRYRVF